MKFPFASIHTLHQSFLLFYQTLFINQQAKERKVYPCTNISYFKAFNELILLLFLMGYLLKKREDKVIPRSKRWSLFFENKEIKGVFGTCL